MIPPRFLTLKQERAIVLRLGLDTCPTCGAKRPLNYREIGKQLGLSHERARQLVNCAWRKLGWQHLEAWK